MRTECRSAIGGSGLAAKAFAPASCFPSSLQRVTFSQVEKLVRRSGAPGTGVRYSTRTKSKLQFIQLVRAHRVMTPVPGELVARIRPLCQFVFLRSLLCLALLSTPDLTIRCLHFGYGYLHQFR